MTTRSRRLLRVLAALTLVCAAGAATVSAQTLPASCTGFTDDPLVPGVTIVKAQHLTELRACVDDLRVDAALTRVTWTDLVIEPGQTVIRTVHIVELRAALTAVYVARGQAEAPYTDPALTAQVTLIRAAHLTEIRQAALRVAGACTPEACGGPANADLEYYHLDALGSVRVVTDEAGQVIRRHDYLPFGEGEPAPPQGEDPLRFAGKEGDPESGLAYFEARYYRAWTGRFTTVDPGHVGGDLFNPQSWNGYAYALNNPLAYVDPTGTLAQGVPGACSAEFSFGQCGGNDLFWGSDGGGIGFEFGNGYAYAQQRGYVAGMPADVWMALEEHNLRTDVAFVNAINEGVQARDQKLNPSVTAEVTSAVIVNENGKPQSVTVGNDPFLALAIGVSDGSKAMTQPSTYGWLIGVSAAGGATVLLSGQASYAAMQFLRQTYWNGTLIEVGSNFLAGFVPTAPPGFSTWTGVGAYTTGLIVSPKVEAVRRRLTQGR